MPDQTSRDWWSVVFCVFYLSSKTRKHVSNSGVRNRSTHMQHSECMRLRSYCNRAVWSAHSRRSVSAIFLLGNCNYVHGAGPQQCFASRNHYVHHVSITCVRLCVRACVCVCVCACLCLCVHNIYQLILLTGMSPRQALTRLEAGVIT